MTIETQTTAPAPETRFLPLSEVLAKTSLSRTSIYRLVKDQNFPKPLNLGVRCARWIEAEVNDWIQSRRDSR